MKKLLLLLVLFASPAYAEQNFVIVFDDSGSMANYLAGRKISRLDSAKVALKQAVSEMPEDTSLGIVCLNRGWLLQLEPLNKQKAITLISGIGCGGGTPLGQAMKRGADELLKARQKQKVGSYTLLVVTDGEADNNYLVDDYISEITARGLRVDAIGLDMRQDHSLKTKVRSYTNASNPEDLTKAISKTLAESDPNLKDAFGSFELIAPLPDGLAEKMLLALVEGNNHLIGEQPKVSMDSAGETVVSQSGIGMMAIGITAGVLLAILALFVFAINQ